MLLLLPLDGCELRVDGRRLERCVEQRARIALLLRPAAPVTSPSTPSQPACLPAHHRCVPASSDSLEVSVALPIRDHVHPRGGHAGRIPSPAPCLTTKPATEGGVPASSPHIPSSPPPEVCPPPRSGSNGRSPNPPPVNSAPLSLHKCRCHVSVFPRASSTCVMHSFISVVHLLCKPSHRPPYYHSLSIPQSRSLVELPPILLPTRPRLCPLQSLRERCDDA